VTLTYVLLQNLRRNRLRTGLTALAFALPMGIFVAAISMVVGLREASAANEKELRLAVTNHVTLVNLLPEGMRRRIEALDATRADHRRLRHALVRRPPAQCPNVVTSLAADEDTFPWSIATSHDARRVERWRQERRAAVIGLGLAREFRCGVGGPITLPEPRYLPISL